MAAAGSGERLGAGGPKAFVPLAGRPMIEWSLDAFRACESVRSIVVAAPPGHDHDLAGDLTVVAGGATRCESVTNAMAVVETELVAIHDAARPLLTPELVEALVADLDANQEAAGVIAASPVTDTIKQATRVGSKGPNRALGSQDDHKSQLEVERTADRTVLWAAQTPQVFRTGELRAALAVDEAIRDAATDEAMLVEQAGGTVLLQLTPGENIKVTTPLDLRVAELLLAERSRSVPE
ncbi:MAG TPA: 2-C-methyl-D-erythritol 4-phosphate cytidylyltransferase [Solirubrobacterales bacterium]|nr:2-C-methyl-D-erythritol 4-phosphate cytidylyltransferase [Solirubrobacterales bacterium]